MYNEFSKIYNKLVYDIDYDFYVNLIKAEIDKNKIIPKNILELGIGTGNLTERLEFKVDSYFGVDLSQEMLEIASNKLKYKENLTLINLDIADFKIENKFNVAISTLDTINYILDSSRLEEAFRNIYNSLVQKSILIFDINSENKLRKVLGDNCYVYEYGNIFYSWQSFLDKEAEIVDFVLDFFIEENGIYKRITEEQSEKIYSVEYINKLLIDVGFKEISYKDFDTGRDVDENSQRILFTALKE
ncbi:class I SAM-dependent DNA methyltransferase [Miniphocaeibacter massiliensis]|uniref:class I SAM-dependent DNA methyltransferase n=1 Tax=Miniphocaeibacter massiliensis TaxID=2041841 RepID=UPI000C07BD1A|nr:class I SAM-dependent methyltransferase [Miniphocaeibacter massiliensis]